MGVCRPLFAYRISLARCSQALHLLTLSSLLRMLALAAAVYHCNHPYGAWCERERAADPCAAQGAHPLPPHRGQPNHRGGHGRQVSATVWMSSCGSNWRGGRWSQQLGAAAAHGCAVLPILQLPSPLATCRYLQMKEKDQERALAMIDEDPGLHGLRHLRAPYLDMEASCRISLLPVAHARAASRPHGLQIQRHRELTFAWALSPS